jgi:hypothetical protein
MQSYLYIYSILSPAAAMCHRTAVHGGTNRGQLSPHLGTPTNLRALFGTNGRYLFRNNRLEITNVLCAKGKGSNPVSIYSMLCGNLRYPACLQRA